jgi:hypothetical protein
MYPTQAKRRLEWGTHQLFGGGCGATKARSLQENAVRIAAYQSSNSIGVRSDHKEELENLLVQVVGMLSAERLITMQRGTLDGTKIASPTICWFILALSVPEKGSKSP